MAKKKKKTKKVVLTILFIIAISSFFVYNYIKGRDPAVEVTTTKVDRKTIVQTVSAVGKIQAETEVKISSETSGEIIFLGVREGDTVSAGELLVKIKPDIIQTQVEQYKAASEASKTEIEARKAELDRATAAFKRIKELYAKEFASQEELDRSLATYNQASSAYKTSLSLSQQSFASFKQISKAAERTTIFAPIIGVVTKLGVEKGEKVVGTAQMAGTEMMKISDLNVMNAVVEIDENDIVNVKIGDTAEIEIDAFPDKVYKGVVVEMGHSAITNQLGTQDQVTNFSVKVRLTDKEGRLRPGMSCSVDIHTNTRYNVLALPLQAVTIREASKQTQITPSKDGPPQEPSKVNKEETKKTSKSKRPPSVVFAMINKKAVLKEIKVGISDNGFIEVTDGLNDGEEIISGPYMAVSKILQNGLPVKLKKVLEKPTDKAIKKQDKK